MMYPVCTDDDLSSNYVDSDEHIRMLVNRALREPLKTWPAEIRRENIYNSGGPWLADLFNGVIDPRLELVGWADISHQQDFENPDICGTGNYVEAIYPVAKLFAQALDPSFNPLDTVLNREHEYTAAAGCGGGFDEERRGNEQQGMVWYDKVDESPSGNDPSAGDWSPYGLAGGYELRIGRYLRYRGYYTFSVSGSTPKVYELAHAWGILLRERKATPDTAAAALKYSREFFKLFEADEVMSRVYQKIINPLSGTPCCPSCKSPNIGEIDGIYEFGLMKCGDCGYEQMCDIYQQGDWYV